MYKLGDPYTWENWSYVPVGTRCTNDEFPGAVFVLARPGFLIWDGNGAQPLSNLQYRTGSDPVLGFAASARWTRPILGRLYPDQITLPVGT